MNAKASLKNLRGSARKARLVLDLVRGMSVDKAQQIVHFSTKKMSNHIEKLLKSAVANAEDIHGKVDTSKMIISEAFADDGPIMKRHRFRAQGRTTIIRKRTCHISLEISDNE